jgi:hypothetical protein
MDAQGGGTVAIKIFSFENPWDDRFAEAGRRGTWYPNPGLGICPECRAARQKRVFPLVIEWVPGSDQIGDFVWPMFGELVVSDKVRRELDASFTGFEFLPIEMIQEPRLKRPSRVTKRTKPRVWLPYDGPALWELRPKTEADLDLAASGFSVRKVCGTCGRTIYNTPPLEGRILVVDPSTWSESDIFGISPFSMVFCVEKVKEFIEQTGFTNVSFKEEGIIPD